MYHLRIEDDAFFVGQRCLGGILEVVVLGADGGKYLLKLEDNNEVFINVEMLSDIDKFLGITMSRPIWIWICENELKAEISNYARLRSRG